MKNNSLIAAKNNTESLFCSILLKATTLRAPDINFYKYETEKFNINNHYETIIAIGLKNPIGLQYKTACLICLNDFQETYEFCKEMTPEIFNNNSVLNNFCEHVFAYLDWTWNDKNLYFGKNIDELSKYYNKVKLVDSISKRIKNEEELVTDIEKELIVFAKKMLTSYIINKDYNIIEYGGEKYACTYSEINEIELANKLLNDNDDIEAVIMINLNNDIVRIKTSKNVDMKDNIVKVGGFINSNGGTIKLSDDNINNFNRKIFIDIIKSLKGGNEDE